MTAPATEETSEPDVECPFHTVITHLAQTAVMQRVLHLEGEALPRAELLDALDGWEQLCRLVRTRVCPATRDVPLTPAELTALVDTAVPHLVPPSVPAEDQARLRRQLAVCARCASPQQCPLGVANRASLAKGNQGEGEDANAPGPARG